MDRQALESRLHKVVFALGVIALVVIEYVLILMTASAALDLLDKKAGFYSTEISRPYIPELE